MIKYPFISVIILLLLLCNGCNFTPTFDVTPTITFKSIGIYKVLDKQRNKVSNIKYYYDSIPITLQYQDGDGDLGLDSTDKRDSLNFDGSINYHYNNYHIKMYKKVIGTYIPVFFTGTSGSVYGFDETFPALTNRDRLTAIKGNLQHYLIIYDQSKISAQVGDTIRYKIYIEDRQLHKSNEITTSDIVIIDYGV